MADYSAYTVPTLSTNYGSGFFEAYDGLVSALQTDINAVQAQIVHSGVGVVEGATAPTGSALIDGVIWVEISGNDRIVQIWNSATTTWDRTGINLASAQTITSAWTMQEISATTVTADSATMNNVSIGGSTFASGGTMAGAWSITGTMTNSGAIDARTGVLQIPVGSSVSSDSAAYSMAVIYDKWNYKLYVDPDKTGYAIAASEMVASPNTTVLTNYTSASYGVVDASAIAPAYAWAVTVVANSNATARGAIRTKTGTFDVGMTELEAGSFGAQVTVPVGSDGIFHCAMIGAGRIDLDVVAIWV